MNVGDIIERAGTRYQVLSYRETPAGDYTIGLVPVERRRRSLSEVMQELASAERVVGYETGEELDPERAELVRSVLRGDQRLRDAQMKLHPSRKEETRP